jgi:hypothetical protein
MSLQTGTVNINLWAYITEVCSLVFSILEGLNFKLQKKIMQKCLNFKNLNKKPKLKSRVNMPRMSVYQTQKNDSTTQK